MTELTTENESTDEFASLWEEYQADYDYVEPERGATRDATVVSASPSAVIFGIGAKQDAFLGSRELEQLTSEDLAALAPGTMAKVYVLRAGDSMGNPIVSLNMAREAVDWDSAQELVESAEIVQTMVTAFNKGGLLSTFKSLQGFIPASQVVNLARRSSDSRPEALAEMVGRELAVKVIEVNRRRRRLILSERAAAREWRSHQRETLLAELAQGQTRTGTVSNLAEFGAFVDLGGMDGLVHLSELSWGRVAHPKEVLKVGQEIQVLVLNVDHERERIGLSIKRLQDDPWTSAVGRYSAGQVVPGVVTHLVSFGAFVEIEPGVEGLVHISELAQGNVAEPRNVVSPGDHVDALILNVDPNRHRIGLSLRQVPVPESILDEDVAEAADSDEQETEGDATGVPESDEGLSTTEAERPSADVVADGGIVGSTPAKPSLDTYDEPAAEPALEPAQAPAVSDGLEEPGEPETEPAVPGASADEVEATLELASDDVSIPSEGDALTTDSPPADG